MSRPYTTLAAIEYYKPCEPGYAALIRVIGKDYPKNKPIYFSEMIDKLDIMYLIWAFRTASKFSPTWVKFAEKCAEPAKGYVADADAAVAAYASAVAAAADAAVAAYASADAAAAEADAVADIAAAAYADAAANYVYAAAAYASTRTEQVELLRELTA
jgi:hypothetical protein